MLEDRGAESLGDELLEELGAAQRAVREIPGEMQAALAQDPAPVRRAHAAIKRFTDLLKGPFVTVLSLSIPDEGAGDND